jgi:hypothetical protein
MASSEQETHARLASAVARRAHAREGLRRLLLQADAYRAAIRAEGERIDSLLEELPTR